MYQKIVAALLFAMVLAGSYMAVSEARIRQLAYWLNEPESYYVGDTPLVTTLDAYSWVRIAEEYKEGIYETGTMDPLAYYPDGAARFEHMPLLPLMLVKISEFTGGNIYRAGIFIFPFLAGLFILPLGILLYRMRAPAAGIVGGLLGGFSAMYISRTNPGRIDTDGVNLFFIFLTPLLIHIAADRKKAWQVWLWSALAGFSQLLFALWYFHYMFILVFLGVLCVVLFLNKQNLKTIAVAAVIYIICSGPQLFAQSFKNFFSLMQAYIFSQENIVGGFPNVYQTITEASRYSVTEVISNFFLHPLFFVLALVGLGIAAWRNWRSVLVLLPVAALAFMTFVSGVRFVIYMVPFLGIGLGYLISLPVGYFVRRINTVLKENILAEHIVTYAVAIGFVALVVMKAPVGFIYFIPPKPSLMPSEFSAIRSLGETLPPRSSIYTWWDYGLAIEAETGFATFHDGMSQNTLKTWLIARSFVSTQDETYRYISYISKGLVPVIDKVNAGQITAQELLDEIDSFDEPLTDDSIHVVFTSDLLSKYVSIQLIGNWDVLNSRYVESPGLSVLNCTPTSAAVVDCGGNKLDTAVGVINSTPLASIDYLDIATGRVSERKETDFSSDLRGIAIMNGNDMMAAVITNDEVYQSSFVQMYILGNYNPALYEEVLNNFPAIRAFHVIAQK